MNINLSTRTYIVICIGIQLAMLGMVFGQKLGINLPVVKQVVGFTYLTFIPGITILKSLTKDKFSYLEEIVCSVGISLAFVMFFGVIINYLGHYLLKIKPISLITLALSMLFVTALMTINCYYVNKKRGNLCVSRKLELRPRELAIISLGLFIILFAIFAGLMTEKTNFFLIILIVVLSIIFAVTTFKSNFEQVNAILIFAISLALLYHITIPTHSLPFLNLDHEFWYQFQVLRDGFWNVSLDYGVNSVLSIVMLTPIYSIILDVSSVGVWKFVFPIIFSLIPVAMYVFYNSSFNKKTAFIACMFFVFTFTFYEFGATIRRQMIAVFFFAIVLMLLTGNKTSKKTQTGLSILFMLCIVVSHYATTYIFIAFLLFLIIISIIVTKINLKAKPFEELRKNINNKKLYIPSLVVIVLLFVSTISWYMHTSTGKQFINLVKIGENFFESLKNFFQPSTRYQMTGSAVGVGFFEAAFWEKVYRVVQYISQVCIVIGVFSLFKKPNYAKNIPQYVVFSFAAVFILFLAMFLPFFSKVLHIHRLYFIVLIVLSPCLVIGFKAIVDFLISNILKVKLKNYYHKIVITWLMVTYLVIYFFFHSGVVFAVLGFGQQMASSGIPASDALSYTKIDNRYANLQELKGAKFISIYGNELVLGDVKYATNILGGWYENKKIKFYHDNINGWVKDDNYYLFLRKWNIENKKVVIKKDGKVVRTKIDYNKLQSKNNLIYKSEDCAIFSNWRRL